MVRGETALADCVSSRGEVERPLTCIAEAEVTKGEGSIEPEDQTARAIARRTVSLGSISQRGRHSQLVEGGFAHRKHRDKARNGEADN